MAVAWLFLAEAVQVTVQGGDSRDSQYSNGEYLGCRWCVLSSFEGDQLTSYE